MIYKGNHKLGDFFTIRRERGTPGLPMLSVTMNNGVVTRESLNRKMETNLSDEEHLLVRKDDIVYNMMRMWQGASGLADRDGLISPAYVVLAPKNRIDPLYASYLFKSSRLIYLLWAYSYGLTSDRLRLYFNDFKRIPVNIPSLAEQRKIGKILSTWDKAIGVTEGIIENSKAQKVALMQKLLTGNMRFQAFGDDWRNAKLQDLAKVEMGSSPKSESYNSDGLGLPLIQGNADIKNGVSAPAFFTSQITKECVEGDILLSVRAPVGTVARSEHHACIGRGIASIQARKLTSQAFLYNWLLAYESKWMRLSQGSTFEALNRNDLTSLHLTIPSYEEQQKIAQVLTAADREIETLQQKLACLKQEKKALMQQLLTGKRRVKVDEL